MRLLNICREHNVMENDVIMDFARNMANGVIDNNFVDQFENTVLETQEEIRNVVHEQNMIDKDVITIVDDETERNAEKV